MSDRSPSPIGELEADQINAEFRGLFAMSLVLANPPTIVQAYRGTEAIGEPVEVQVIPANRQSREANGLGALDVSFSGGQLRAWSPWDVERGDVVTLGNATAVIRDTPPARNGIQSASYEIEDGGGV